MIIYFLICKLYLEILKPMCHEPVCMDARTDESAKRTESEVYLPGMPKVSAEAGRVERFLRNLLRQRGRYRVRLSRKGR